MQEDQLSSTPLLEEQQLNNVSKKQRMDNHLKAVFWVILTAAFFSISMTLAKLLDSTVNPVTLVFSRSFAGALIAMPLFIKVGFSSHFRSKKIPLHFLRVIIVCSAMGCTYYAYRNLPISYAAAIGQTGPLFTTVFAIVFLRERVGWVKWVALGVGYLGVLLMVRPSEGFIDFATVIALAANVLTALGLITTKKLTDTDATETILFYVSFGVVAISGLGALWFWQTPSNHDLLLLGGMGVSGVLSQYCFINSLKNAPASFVTPFEYIRLCMSIPIGYIVFNEIPDYEVIFGSLIIVIAVVFLVRGDQRELLREK